MPRGQKQCKSCGEPSGPRTKICPKCNTPFLMKDSGENSLSLDDYLTNDSRNYLSPSHESAYARRTCALCQNSYSANNSEKDCFGVIIYKYKYGIYCGEYCYRKSLLEFSKIILKLKNQEELLEKEIKLIQTLEDRLDEIEKFNSQVENNPFIHFIIKPDKKKPLFSKEEALAMGFKEPRRPPLKGYQSKADNIDDDSDDLGLVGFSGLVEAEFEEKKEPIETNSGLVSPVAPKPNGFEALTVKKPIASGFEALTATGNKPTAVNSQDKDPGRGPGRKQCKNCKFHIGVRSHTCKFCGHSC